MVKIPWNKGRRTGEYKKCLICGNKFYVISSELKTRKYCSQKCYMVDCVERVRKMGLNNRKYKTKEERKQANLASGRKCYRKHLKERQFYYRKLNCIRRGIEGRHTIKQWNELKEKYNFTCLCCGGSEPDIILTEDHIVPISKWNEWIKKHPEVKYKCNDIENIQPLCGKCNCIKLDKLISNEELKKLIASK